MTCSIHQDPHPHSPSRSQDSSGQAHKRPPNSTPFPLYCQRIHSSRQSIPATDLTIARGVTGCHPDSAPSRSETQQSQSQGTQIHVLGRRCRTHSDAAPVRSRGETKIGWKRGRSISSSSVHLGVSQGRCPLESSAMVKADMNKSRPGLETTALSSRQSENTQWVCPFHSPIPIRQRHRVTTPPLTHSPPSIPVRATHGNQDERDAKKTAVPSVKSSPHVGVHLHLWGSKCRTWKGLETPPRTPLPPLRRVNHVASRFTYRP